MTDDRPLHSPMPEAARQVFDSMSRLLRGFQDGAFDRVNSEVGENDAISVLVELTVDMFMGAADRIATTKDLSLANAANAALIDFNMRLHSRLISRLES